MPEPTIFRTIREQIVSRLRDDIIAKNFPPGESLREYALSKRYGVSRSPERDALLQLTQEGLLVATPHCGVRVASKIDDELQPLVVDLRSRIEGYALSMAMKQLNGEGKALLEERLAEMLEACKSEKLPAIIKADMNFHRAIVALADNEDIMSMWQPIVSSMMLHYERHSGWMDSYAEHKAIVDAILAGDKRAAKKALTANIK